MHHIHAPAPAPHSSFTQLLTTPSSCPSNPRPSNPSKPTSQPAPKVQHNETAQNRGTDAGKQGSSYQKHAAALPACGRGLVGSQSPPLVAPRGQKWHSSFACDTQRKSQTNETDEIDETDETDERDCEMGDSRGQPRCKGRGWVGGCRELRSGAAGPGGRGTQSGEAVERAGEREAGAGGGVAADLKLS